MCSIPVAVCLIYSVYHKDDDNIITAVNNQMYGGEVNFLAMETTHTDISWNITYMPAESTLYAYTAMNFLPTRVTWNQTFTCTGR